jgi:hypothetical protein
MNPAPVPRSTKRPGETGSSPPADEDRRTAVALIGILIWHSDWIRPGGSIEVGLPLAIIGVLISFVAPNMLTRKWRTPPEQ